MSAKKSPAEQAPRRGLGMHPDGHPLLDGARWHVPKHGSPTECATPGCDRLMGQRPETVLEAADEPTDTPADASVDGSSDGSMDGAAA